MGLCLVARIAAALFSLQRWFPAFVSQGLASAALCGSASIAAVFLSMENTAERIAWAPGPGLPRTSASYHHRQRSHRNRPHLRSRVGQSSIDASQSLLLRVSVVARE